MSLSTQPYKGTRDFYPEDMRRQKWMFNKMRQAVERFGYEEYNAPLLEPLEIYAAKTGQEIVNEQTYAFEDRGGRKVVVRPEMTPSVSRMIAAKRQELAYPMRLFNIGNRWRYERPQRGRLREFYQLDVDIFGVDNLSAEVEAIQVADQVLQKFGAKRKMYQIKLNSRKLVDALLFDQLELNQEQALAVTKLVDRMNKMEKPAFDSALASLFTIQHLKDGKLEQLKEFLNTNDLSKLPDSESVQRLKELSATLEGLGITNVEFDPTLMRGFDYYTDIVFEVFDCNPENNRSMFGGGRYSGLVGLFGVEPIEAVGFAMGDVTLANFLESNKLLQPLKPETELYVVLIGDVQGQAQKVVADLREMGVNVALDITGRKPDKQTKTAAKKGIRYVLFIGEEEIKNETYKLKDLLDGTEESHGAQRLVSIIQDRRQA